MVIHFTQVGDQADGFSAPGPNPHRQPPGSPVFGLDEIGYANPGDSLQVDQNGNV